MKGIIMRTFSEWKKHMKELHDKQEEYKCYIEDHVNNVIMIWDNIKDELPISDELKDEVDDIIPLHDESKYSKEEFEPYRNFFYPCKDEEKNQQAFDMAWNHHQKMNPHHWQYWIFLDDDTASENILPMDEKYILELLCDWSAMSYKFNNSVKAWYNDNKDTMRLHEDTRNKIEELIDIFDNKLKEI